MKKDKITYILYILLLTVFFCSTVEVGLRIKGKKPWDPKPVDIVVEPNTRTVLKDGVLGFIPAPGKRKVTVNKGLVYTVTILDNNTRITHPLETYRARSEKDEIWLFGDSFTAGVCNDNETYPWLLQEKMPEYEIVNFGLGGGSTLQSLLWFKKALKSGRSPKIAVIAYAAFHDERNTFSRGRRRDVVPYNHLGPVNIPYARLDLNGNIRYYGAEAEYKEFPLMRHSALVAWFEEMYDKIETRFMKSHEVSKAIIKEFDGLCRKNNIRLIVAGIMADRGTKDMLRYCQKEGISSVDISVDLSRKGYTSAPYDMHPSALADQEYAEKLRSFINKR